jgi:hypothetical protein
MVVPKPICDTDPLPEMTPAKVIVSLRSKTSAPLSVTLPTMPPVAPPSPGCEIPDAIVVPPV